MATRKKMDLSSCNGGLVVMSVSQKLIDKGKTGTREWAESNLNIQLGCEHGCRYCYARYMAVEQHKHCTAEQWANPVINTEKVNKGYRKRPGVIMFPSTHDITPKNVAECICVLRKLLEAGNQVLIVSKSHFNCISFICDTLEKFKDQILFRFTIGSMSDNVLKFWELEAPSFGERYTCLGYAFNYGFKTSVSAEPFLDGNVRLLYEALKPLVTDSFWIGKLRDLHKRVDLSSMTVAEIEQFVEPLELAQTDKAIKKLYADLDGRKFIKWKDSIKKVCCPSDLRRRELPK